MVVRVAVDAQVEQHQEEFVERLVGRFTWISIIGFSKAIPRR
jgi:hypothetical protein